MGVESNGMLISHKKVKRRI